MREVPSYIAKRLQKNIQTRANNAAPSAKIWVGRKNTILENDEFLERQTVINSSVTDASIAVSHPRIRRANSNIYMAYVSGGVAKVVTSPHKSNMSDHIWRDTGFSEAATAVSIAFDGTMPKSTTNEVEFVTEKTPWVFWVNDGMLFAQKLGGETITLAESNCVDVSAIRAAHSQASTFDFGLVVFFILGSSLYYRQLINGKWMDAELVSFGPTGVYWSAVSASRTWDYRVVVQLKSTNGDIYELFTQFMGIGTRNSEHVEIVNAKKTNNTLTAIEYTSVSSSAEHVTVSNAINVTPYQGLYTLGIPTLVSVTNVIDDSNDWGKQVLLTFDKELDNETVQSSIGSFYFVDENEDYYFPISIKMDRTGRRAMLTFVDFNNARGVCAMHYDPGTVVTMMEETLSAQYMEFVPTGLIPNDAVLPEVADMWNLNEIGTEVAIRFTEPLISAPVDSANKFIVTIAEPEYSPGGALTDSVKPVVSVSGYVGMNETIDLSAGVVNGVRMTNGKLSLEVAPVE